MSLPKTVMMVGIGDLAGLVLNHLVQRPRFGRIVLAGRKLEEVRRRRNLALLFSAQLGYYHDIDCVELDLDDAGASAETIARVKPDLVFNTASAQSWRYLTYLPKEVFARLDEAQFGPWLPLHLATAHSLARAVRGSGLKPTVVNAAFPDAVGPVLRAAGLAPDIGIGNVANVLPALRGAVGLVYGVPIERVEASLVAQHFISHRLPAYGDAGGAPHIFRARVDGGEVDADEARIFSLVKTDFARTGGAFRQLITAASALSVLVPLIEGSQAVAHAPAPGGLVGGYPVRLSGGRAELALPEGIRAEEAIRVNEECQKFDGIEAIEADGTVRFRSDEMAVMREFLGYDCPTLRLEEAADRSAELRAKFLALAASCGVSL